MSTLPSRIGQIRPALESLASQTHVPDLVVLSVPQRSEREDAAYELPAFLDDFADLVTVHRASADWGPGTKLLGALEATGPGHPDDVMICADDDVQYEPFVVAELVEAVRAGDPASFYTDDVRGVSVGFGCDGFAMPRRCTEGMQEFFNTRIADSPARLVDDVWISFYLETKGARVASLNPLLKQHGLQRSYKQAIEDEGLASLNGSLGRQRLNRSTIDGLMRSGGPTTKMAVRYWPRMIWAALRNPRRELSVRR